MQPIYWLLFLIVVVFGIGAFWCFERYSIRVKQYTVCLNNLPANFSGLTILHLSDLHSKQFGRRQTKLVRLINQQKYDLVALTGDFVNKFKPDIKPMIDLINQLNKVPVYFVPGNHERKTGFQARESLNAAGVRILDNKAVRMVKNGQCLWIIGVDDPHLGKACLNAALEQVDDSAPKILLAHSPNIYPEAIEKRLDLVLAGHTHGGQVRLPLIGALIAPGQGLFPQWDYGLYQKGQTTMIINGGLGESDLPVRFNIKPEIGLVKLLPA